MAKSFSAQVSSFVQKSEEKMRKVMQRSVQDVLSAAQTAQPSTARSIGPFEQGKIPVDTGFLRNSLISGLNGSFGDESPDSYILTIAGMEIGDTMQFGWTAPYAARIEYGFFGDDSAGRTFDQPGRHFVGVNAAKWQDIVAKNARRRT